MAITRPRWADVPPGGAYVGAIEPSEGKKDQGFANGEEPAAGHVNWLFQNLAQTADAAQQEVVGAVVASGQVVTSSDKHQLHRALVKAQIANALCSARVVATPSMTAGWRGAVFANEFNARVVAVGQGGQIGRLTEAGLFVKDTPASSYAGEFRGVAYQITSALFGIVAVGQGEEIQTSYGGYVRRHTGTYNLNAVTFGAGAMVACGDHGTIYSSTSLATWTSHASAHGTNHNLAIAYGAGVFVIAGDGGLQSSPDGVTWTGRSSTAARTVNYVTGFGFVAVGAFGTLYTSLDGLTWTDTSAGYWVSARRCSATYGSLLLTFRDSSTAPQPFVGAGFVDDPGTACGLMTYPWSCAVFCQMAHQDFPSNSIFMFGDGGVAAMATLTFAPPA